MNKNKNASEREYSNDARSLPCALIDFRDPSIDTGSEIEVGRQPENGDPWAKPEFGLHRLINSGALNEFPVSVVKAYIEENGCDVNLRDSEGVTPLHQAADFGLHSIAKLLIQYGADVNAQDEMGWTPLINTALKESIYWVKDGMLETAKVLVEAGADISIKCHEGKTAIDYAKETYFDRGVYYLLAGIDDNVNAYPVLASKPLGKKVKVKAKDSARYYMHNGELMEFGPGEFFRGVLSGISDSPAGDDQDDPERASCKIISIDETNANGSKTWNLYKFHHDDIEIEVLDSPIVEDSATDISFAMGFIVEVCPKRNVDIYYHQCGTSKVLHPDEKFVGYFWQMTEQVNDGGWRTAHIQEIRLLDPESKRFEYMGHATFNTADVSIQIRALRGPASNNRYVPSHFRSLETWNSV